MATSYAGTVHFLASDGAATLPADAALPGGAGTFAATFRTQGSQSIFAIDTTDGTINGTSLPIAVTAGPATHLAVSMPANATAGVPATVSVIALDVLNNVATAYGGTVHFTSSDGTAVLPGDAALAGGVGSFSVTFQASGTQTVTATDTVTPSIAGASNPVNVSPGAATHFSVSSAAAATAGTPSTVSVIALDAFNNTATAYSGVVHFTSTDTAAALPPDSTLAAGIGSFGVTFKTAGNRTITATDTLSSSVTGTSNTVAVSAGTATHLTVGAPATATSGSAFSVTVTALDAFNNVATAYAGIVHFTSSDASATLPANSTLASGVATFSATLANAGNQTVTATDTVTPSINGTSGAIAVAPGAVTHFTVSAPASASSGTAVSVNVTALDASNNLVPGYAGTVHFTSSDAQAVLPANSTLTAGVGTFSVTLKTVGSRTVTATDTVTSSITGASAAINVSPGAATHYSITAPATATAGTPFSVTVTALDAAGNVATGYSGTIHFTSNDAQAVVPADVTLVSGVGTFSVTLRTPGSRTASVTDTATSSITATSGAITVTAGAATHFTVSAPANVAGGSAFTFTVSALDASNNAATGYSGTVHFTSGDASATVPADAALAGGTGTFSATLRASGNQSLTVTDTASSSITGTSGAIAVSMNSYSAASATGTGTITATFTGGGPTCAFASPQFIGAPPGSPPVPPTLPAPATAFPQGMFDFSITGCTPGSAITMTITYPQSVSGMRYWKYGPEASNPSPHWYVLPATITGNTATFVLTDGGVGDDDLAANGVIDDQGGPGTSSPSVVPTLSEWMVGLLALMLFGSVPFFVKKGSDPFIRRTGPGRGARRA